MGAQPPKQRSVVVPVLLTLLVVVVLAAVGIGIYLVKTRTTTVPEAIPSPNTCVIPNGLAYPNTKLNPVDCGVASSYTVLQTFTGSTDKSKCTNVTGVSQVFTFTASGSDGESYVLCLKKN